MADLALAGRLEQVERPRRRGEEAEGVEVRAADLVRLHDRVGARGAQPQRPAGVPDLVLAQPVDHRPLVQPEAAELARRSRGWPRAGRRRTALSRHGTRRSWSGRAARRRGRPPCRTASRRAGDRPPRRAPRRPRVPAAQLGRPLGVVGEEEVLDRVPAPVLAARSGGRRWRRRRAPRGRPLPPPTRSWPARALTQPSRVCGATGWPCPRPGPCWTAPGPCWTAPGPCWAPTTAGG